MHYWVAIEELDENRGDMVIVPDLPGCIASAPSWEQALQRARQAVDACLAPIPVDALPATTPLDLLVVRQRSTVTWLPLVIDDEGERARVRSD